MQIIDGKIHSVLPKDTLDEALKICKANGYDVQSFVGAIEAQFLQNIMEKVFSGQLAKEMKNDQQN